jgi:hypothetical protein
MTMPLALPLRGCRNRSARPERPGTFLVRLRRFSPASGLMETHIDNSNEMTSFKWHPGWLVRMCSEAWVCRSPVLGH